jgi:hypothetical protein
MGRRYDNDFLEQLSYESVLTKEAQQDKTLTLPHLYKRLLTKQITSIFNIACYFFIIITIKKHSFYDKYFLYAMLFFDSGCESACVVTS